MTCHSNIYKYCNTVYIKKGGSVRDLRDGETVLYVDCDGGYTDMLLLLSRFSRVRLCATP